jgi:hypothetical protein
MEKRLYPAGGNAARDARFLSHRALKCQSGQAVLGSFWPAKAGFGENPPQPWGLLGEELDQGFPVATSIKPQRDFEVTRSCHFVI